MIEQDKRAFKDMMNSIMTIYSRPLPDQDLLRIWFMKLEKYDFDAVCKAFDKWVDSSKHCPTIYDILNLIRPKIEFVPSLQAPKLTIEQNKNHSDKLMAEVQKRMPKEEKKLKDYRAWAHRIIANPKKYPAISLQFAKEALHAN